MTTPNGNPAWTRSADHTFYGGHASKANYNGEPIVNPRTDVGADSIQRMATDLAAVARMAPFAVGTFSSPGAGGAVTVTACRLMTGAVAASYSGTSPPAGFPSITHAGSGVYVVEIGKAYTDDYSVVGVFEPVFAFAQCINQAVTTRAYTSGTADVYIESFTGSTPVDVGIFSFWIA